MQCSCFLLLKWHIKVTKIYYILEHKSTGVAAACSVSQFFIFSNHDLLFIQSLIYRNCVLLLLNQIRYLIIIRIYKLHSSLIKSTNVFVAIILLISSSVLGNVNTSQLAISPTSLSKEHSRWNRSPETSAWQPTAAIRISTVGWNDSKKT